MRFELRCGEVCGHPRYLKLPRHPAIKLAGRAFLKVRGIAGGVARLAKKTSSGDPCAASLFESELRRENLLDLAFHGGGRDFLGESELLDQQAARLIEQAALAEGQ